MPRLKPPPARAQIEPEDNSLPTEPVEIELTDEPVEIEVDLAPQPAPALVAPVVEPEPTDENQLQRQLEADRLAEQLQRDIRDRDRQLRERDVELVRERGRGDEAEYNSVLTAIAAEQATVEKAESDYAAYAASGDWGNAAKAQRIMATASSRLDRLEDNKVGFETKREAAKTASPEQRPAPQQNFEQRIADLPDAAKTWLRKHPEFVNDTSLNEKIGRAHNYLVGNKSLSAFSPAYFDALDDEFGFKVAPTVPPQPQPQRRSMPVSAPVSREVPTISGQRASPSKITLSPEEVRIARSAFTAPDMTNAQKELLYARNKQKLQRMRANGEYRQTTEQTG